MIPTFNYNLSRPAKASRPSSQRAGVRGGEHTTPCTPCFRGEPCSIRGAHAMPAASAVWTHPCNNTPAQSLVRTQYNYTAYFLDPGAAVQQHPSWARHICCVLGDSARTRTLHQAQYSRCRSNNGNVPTSGWHAGSTA